MLTTDPRARCFPSMFGNSPLCFILLVFYFMTVMNPENSISFSLFQMYFYTIDHYLPSYNNLLPRHQLFYVSTLVSFLELEFGKLKISGDSSFHNFGLLSLFFKKREKRVETKQIRSTRACFSQRLVFSSKPM